MNNTDNNIDILIWEGEGLTVEFKERFTPRIDEDIVAFANTKGGMILLGVRDDQTVRGEILTNSLKARINSVARNCNPPVPVEIKQTKENIVSIKGLSGNRCYCWALRFRLDLVDTIEQKQRNSCAISRILRLRIG